MTAESAETMRSAQVDAYLRRIYQASLDDEVPERFRQLLDRLREETEGDRKL